MNIYLAHPVTGLSYAEVIAYYDRMIKILSDCGYNVFSPLIAEEYLGTEKKMSPVGYGKAMSTDHAIVRRDRWMVYMSHVVFINLIGATDKSIGCVSELMWGYEFNKHTICAMEKNNIHHHAFIHEASDVIFETEDAAVDYLRILPKGKAHK